MFISSHLISSHLISVQSSQSSRRSHRTQLSKQWSLANFCRNSQSVNTTYTSRAHSSQICCSRWPSVTALRCPQSSHNLSPSSRPNIASSATCRIFWTTTTLAPTCSSRNKTSSTSHGRISSACTSRVWCTQRCSTIRSRTPPGLSPLSVLLAVSSAPAKELRRNWASPPNSSCVC